MEVERRHRLRQRKDKELSERKKRKILRREIIGGRSKRQGRDERRHRKEGGGWGIYTSKVL